MFLNVVLYIYVTVILAILFRIFNTTAIGELTLNGNNERDPLPELKYSSHANDHDDNFDKLEENFDELSKGLTSIFHEYKSTNDEHFNGP